ncbi:hypothetical protein FDECE_4910 [Fusarium decemcellulare]|nr:hypothetical protein FDECE_4910 [Fusarium decemcellulare]
MVVTKDAPEYVPIDSNFKPLPKNGHLSELDPEFAQAKPAIDHLMEEWWEPSRSLEEFRQLWQLNQAAPEGCPVEGEDVLTETQQIPMRDGALVEIKIYRAKDKKPGSALVMRFHGGGWVVGGHCTEHAENLVIAGKTNSVVVSVDYRMAPEFRFPYAVNDSFDGLKWAKANATCLGVDAEKIILIGGSAGANLAAVVALIARDEGISGVVTQVLSFPVACHPKFHPTEKYELGSYKQNYNASVVNAVRMEWFLDLYMPEPTPDWRFSPLLAPSLKGLPPALVLVAGYDTLRDEGIAYAERLKEEGVETGLHTYQGVPHCFPMLPTHPKTVDYYDKLVKHIRRFTRACHKSPYSQALQHAGLPAFNTAMAVLSTLRELLWELVSPYLFMGISVRFLPGTVLGLLASRDFRTLFSPSAFKETWFGNFWAFMGPQVKINAERRVIPLLEGRVHDGRVGEDVVGEPINGIVLEIGAGSGMWADVFAKVGGGIGVVGSGDDEVRRRKGGNGLTRVYGIEPNPQSAAALRRRVKDVGLEGVYEVVPVGIESINDPTAWDGRIEPESVDCIVTILCLCSIPEPEKNIRMLYNSLKKGGRWYAYEHVRVERGRFFLSAFQWLTNLVWSQAMGSCRICRNTGKTLIEAGPWEKIDLAHPDDEARFALLPHVLGTLTK